MTTNILTPPTPGADADLVNASLSGDRDAFGRIVARYQSLVCSVVYSATGDLGHSEDVAQETFIAAWKQMADLREPAKLRSWLCGIARNLVRNHLRAQGRDPSHRASSLDDISEPPAPEPLPVERAISREEAEILWRTLEQIPETYREPLVLYYREHQSVKAVARDLELTEEAVRQRLARGRKLLQEEVLAFVETALEKTSPGSVFTQTVVGALPAVASAKAASAGSVLAKSAGAKGWLSLGKLGVLWPTLGVVAFQWMAAVKDTKSPRERRFMTRVAWFQIAFAAVSMGIGLYWLPRLLGRRLDYWVALAAGLLAYAAIIVVSFIVVLWRRMCIGIEEGTWTDELDISEQETDRKAFRRSATFALPMLFLIAFSGFFLPWKLHWGRCLVLMGVLSSVVLWGLRSQYHQLRNASRGRLPEFTGWRHPLVLIPAYLLGLPLMMFALCYGMNRFIYSMPVPPGGLIAWALDHSWWIVAVVLAYAALAIVLLRAGIWKSVSALLGQAGRRLLRLMMELSSLTSMEKNFGPLFQQLSLTRQQRSQMKDLLFKKATQGSKRARALMNPRLTAQERAALAAEVKRDMEGVEAEIRRLLGEEGYRVFQRYEKTVSDRLMIEMFSRKTAGTPAALSRETKEELIRALSRARAQFHWTTDISRRNQLATDYALMFSEENIRVFGLEEEQFNQAFLAEAAELLAPQQVAMFRQFQEKQRQSQIAMYKMATRMFAPKGCG
jgi:RNA polymerase sigma factor (sigma-70 family)